MSSITTCIYIAGIHVLNRSGNKLSYLLYNLSTCKVEQDSVFPTDTQAFIGASEKAVSLHNGGEVSRQCWSNLTRFYYKSFVCKQKSNYWA